MQQIEMGTPETSSLATVVLQKSVISPQPAARRVPKKVAGLLECVSVSSRLSEP